MNISLHVQYPLLLYKNQQQDLTLAVIFISHGKITLHVATALS
jgi:hypothetical protein